MRSESFVSVVNACIVLKCESGCEKILSEEEEEKEAPSGSGE